ncbi:MULTISPECIES: hypothetical protein [Bacillaceae]|uniref:Uncharacterized protein n=1 Tax=Evansella alkalicola TaxID=745819 RepID=A0ABS6JXK1_9BACI|nr:MULTISPECIES: hypothetical protein [Bacillaceae]MBU9723324.1 hypothetical protein [Bacillus alkalicola]
MQTLKNIDSDTLFPYLMTSGLILLISAFFMPFAAIMLVQDLLFYSPDHWSFIRPTEAYLAFFIGMIWIALIVFSFLFTKMHIEKKGREYKLTWIHIINFVFAIGLLILSIYHYAYLDEEGAHANSFWTFTEKSIAWNDVHEVTRLVEEGSLGVISYTFSNDDTSITIPFDYQDYHTNRAIKRIRELYDWEIVDIVN